MGLDLMSKIQGNSTDSLGKLGDKIPPSISNSKLPGEPPSPLDAVMKDNQMPYANYLADLKGVCPNPITLKKIFTPGSQIPEEFLKDFNPDADVLTTFGIETPKLNLPPVGDKISGSLGLESTDFDPKDPPVEPEIDVELLKQQGVSNLDIQKLQAARELREQKNKIATKLNNALKSQAKAFIQSLNKKAQEAIDKQIASGVAKATDVFNKSPLAGLPAKIAAYKYFKAKINAQIEKVEVLEDELKKDIDECKKVAKDSTQQLSLKGTLKGVSSSLKAAKTALKGQTDTMKPTFPMHPGPGNLSDASVVQAADDAKDESMGFEENLKQTEKNAGEFLKKAQKKLGKLTAVLALIYGLVIVIKIFLKFLKQMLELLFLLFLKNDAKTKDGNLDSLAKSPEEFLADSGYPGFSNEDFSKLVEEIEKPEIKPISPPDLRTPLTNKIKEFQGDTGRSVKYNTTDPLKMGDYTVGIPLTQNDIDMLDFEDHPIMGDMRGIHPQIINEWYRKGIIPPPHDPTKLVKKLNPDLYEEALEKIYDDILKDLQGMDKEEHIEKIYDAKFEMIGYRRFNKVTKNQENEKMDKKLY